MNRVRSMTLAIAMMAVAAAPAHAADFLVNVKVLCTRTDVDSAGQEKLVRESQTREQILKICLDSRPEPLTLNDLELTYDANNGVLHVVRKCDGAELCELGSGYCVEAINESVAGSTSKLSANSLCSLDIFFTSDAVDMFGGALGKEKVKSESVDNVETKLAFKGAYQGQFVMFTFFDALVCTIKFTTGARFEPTGGLCPE
jgi:hypothetical protein